jgi:hypothetical protein
MRPRAETRRRFPPMCQTGDALLDRAWQGPYFVVRRQGNGPDGRFLTNMPPNGDRKASAFLRIGFAEEVACNSQTGWEKRLEKIELIDTLLEYAAGIVTDLKGARRLRNSI